MFTLDIPHAETGHNSYSYDPADAESVKLAESTFQDLLKQGYAIFLESDGKTERVTGFNPKAGTFKIGNKEVPAEGTTATAVAPSAGGCALAD
jgi:hypothetical protein